MKLVVTIIGKDKPGLVEAVSETALAHGANWEASEMMRLGGRFAGMLLVSVPDAKAPDLETALKGLDERGLRVLVDRADAADDGGDVRTMQLELIGQDRQGIIATVSATLAKHNVNVDELSTSVEEAPMAGGTLFKLLAGLRVPAAVDDDALRGDLELLSNELMVDIDLGSE